MFLRHLTKRFYSNLHTNFTELEPLNAYLLKHKYAHNLVYFRASWNPHCEITDQHVRQIASENRFLEVFTIDSDASPKIARHYAAKNQPEFVFCLYGDEVLRQIGPNLEGLRQKLNKMVKLGEEGVQIIHPNQSKWLPYGSRFQKYYIDTLQLLYEENVNNF